MKKVLQILPWIVLVFASIYAAQKVVRPDTIDSKFDLNTFRSLPVSANGRTKPLDTVARNSLLMMSGRQTITVDTSSVVEGVETTVKSKMSAIEWYIELLTDFEIADSREVFRIDHPALIALLGLDGENRTRFSFAEIFDKGDKLNEQVNLASGKKSKDRDPRERALLTLYQRLTLFSKMKYKMTPYFLPPMTESEEWRSFANVIATTPDDPSVLALDSLLKKYSAGEAELFNTELAEYAALMEEVLPEDTTKAKSEVTFNQVQPFYISLVLYVIAFLVGCFGLLLSQLSKDTWSKALLRSMTSLVVVAFIVQTIGIASRVYLQGRPPVTNLYSSAVFIGWFGVLIGLVIDRRMKLGLGGIMASVLGFGSLVVAHNLGGSGDTMEMMQAVLDSNFWLATHVVVITIGYSATFFAGFLGIAYVLLGIFTKVFDYERGKSLVSMVYGVICFAALMSFVGTVLGGIWADQSWGRFWGWDAKENGAAIIVLMTLLILHARWAGMIKDRGIIVLAISCNIITAWSWFGTNMLGVGLHSYGFTESAVFWISVFVLSQLFLMGLGLLPKSMWRSKFERTPRV